MKKVYTQIVEGIREYFGEAGFSRAVIGLSGGIDSSLTLKLAVDALGPENVTGILMPELGLTSRENIEHANKLASFFDVETYKVPINGFLTKFEDLPWSTVKKHEDGLHLANMNIKARARMMILYHYANVFGALVLGTSNKSELLLGYGTKYGDAAADILPIGDLYKTEVRNLAAFLDLPPEIVNKKPSAELYKDQTDADELGADYEVLDQILLNQELGVLKLADKGFDANLVKHVFDMVKINSHKTKPIHTIKVHEDV